MYFRPFSTTIFLSAEACKSTCISSCLRFLPPTCMTVVHKLENKVDPHNQVSRCHCSTLEQAVAKLPSGLRQSCDGVCVPVTCYLHTQAPSALLFLSLSVAPANGNNIKHWRFTEDATAHLRLYILWVKIGFLKPRRFWTGATSTFDPQAVLNGGSDTLLDIKRRQ